MRLPKLKKEPEPEEPVIHVTATGEQRAPARGRSKAAQSTKPLTSVSPETTNRFPPPGSRQPETIRERFGKARPEQPTYTEQEPSGMLEEKRAKRYEDAPDRDWVKLITGGVFGVLAVGLIALGAILFSLPTSPANIAWIHAETAGLAIMLVLLYVRKP